MEVTPPGLLPLYLAARQHATAACQWMLLGSITSSCKDSPNGPHALLQPSLAWNALANGLRPLLTQYMIDERKDNSSSSSTRMENKCLLLVLLKPPFSEDLASLLINTPPRVIGSRVSAIPLIFPL